jgi:hypothetical protein
MIDPDKQPVTREILDLRLKESESRQRLYLAITAGAIVGSDHVSLPTEVSVGALLLWLGFVAKIFMGKLI